MSKSRDVPDDHSGSREAPDKFLQPHLAPRRPYQPPQRFYQLVDPALKKILVGILGDDGSIKDSLASALWKTIPDVISQYLDGIDALSLPATKKYLLKTLKGYFWWYHIQTGRPPSFASITREKFDSFRNGQDWNPETLFGAFIPEPEEPEQHEIHSLDLER